MKIIVVGAGAIGSLYGGLLAKKNEVVLVGRAPHITTIQHTGLTIKGNTHVHVKIPAVESIQDITISPDLVLLTVKSYDTEIASKQVRPLFHSNTVLLSLQNGLNNIEKIQRSIPKNNIIAGISTHGVILSKPGEIDHAGKGNTILGELSGQRSQRLETIAHIFNDVGIKTQLSDDILKEIWIKTIINSSINPITGFFRCKNGYLLKNPLLEKIVEQVCTESTMIASSEGIQLSPLEMIKRTKEVIRDTAQNYSSMLQSVQQRKKTEIDSLNGILARIGSIHKIDASLNTILTELISSLPQS